MASRCAVWFCLAAAACAPALPPDPGAGPDRAAQPRLLVLGAPPRVAAATAADLPDAGAIARRSTGPALAGRTDAQWVDADALPYLTGSAAGRDFLNRAAPRALARGAPADRCPTVQVAGGTDRGDAAARALGQCLAALAQTRPPCGCEVVALDDLVTVPRDEVAYATGTTARLIGPGIDALWVAEEQPGGRILLRDLVGPVALVTRDPGDGARLDLLRDPGRLEGFRLGVGFRRGRLAERIYLRDDQGRRFSLLIGFAPAELAAGAGAWLAWPAAGG